MKKAEGTESASALIDQRIAELGDWRGEMLAQIRAAVTLNLAKKPSLTLSRGERGLTGVIMQVTPT